MKKIKANFWIKKLITTDFSDDTHYITTDQPIFRQESSSQCHAFEKKNEIIVITTSCSNSIVSKERGLKYFKIKKKLFKVYLKKHEIKAFDKKKT